jgi:hypothetical protein
MKAIRKLYIFTLLDAIVINYNFNKCFNKFLHFSLSFEEMLIENTHLLLIFNYKEPEGLTPVIITDIYFFIINTFKLSFLQNQSIKFYIETIDNEYEFIFNLNTINNNINKTFNNELINWTKNQLDSIHYLEEIIHISVSLNSKICPFSKLVIFLINWIESISLNTLIFIIGLLITILFFNYIETFDTLQSIITIGGLLKSPKYKDLLNNIRTPFSLYCTEIRLAYNEVLVFFEVEEKNKITYILYDIFSFLINNFEWSLMYNQEVNIYIDSSEGEYEFNIKMKEINPFYIEEQVSELIIINYKKDPLLFKPVDIFFISVAFKSKLNIFQKLLFHINTLINLIHRKLFIIIFILIVTILLEFISYQQFMEINSFYLTFILFYNGMRLERDKLIIDFNCNNKLIRIIELIYNILDYLFLLFKFSFLINQEIIIHILSSEGEFEFILNLKSNNKKDMKREFINFLIHCSKEDSNLYKKVEIFHVSVSLNHKLNPFDKIYIHISKFIDLIPTWIFIIIFILLLSFLTFILYDINSNIDLSMAMVSSRSIILKRGLDKKSLKLNLDKYLKKQDFRSKYLKLFVKLNHGYEFITLGKSQIINLNDKMTLSKSYDNIFSKLDEYVMRYQIEKMDTLSIYSLELTENQYYFLSKIHNTTSTFSSPINFPYEKEYTHLGRYEKSVLGYQVFNLNINGQDIQKLDVITISNSFRIISIFIGDKIYRFKETVNSIEFTVTRDWEDGSKEIINLNTNLNEIFTPKSEEMKIDKIRPGYDLSETSEKLTNILEKSKSNELIHNKISSRISQEFLGITMDIETFYKEIKNNGKIEGRLSIASIAFYHPEIGGKFYNMQYRINSFDLLKEVIKDLFEFVESMNGKLGSSIPIYMHNGKRFDFIFLIRDLVTVYVNSDKEYSIVPIVKDNSFIQIDLIKKNKDKTTTTLSFRDSYLILPNSLSKLCKSFSVESQKGIFPYSFMSDISKISYSGEVPDIKYFTGIDMETYKKYSSQFKIWNLLEQLEKYNIIDCISLYQILEKFNEEIVKLFNVNINSSPSLPSLAYKIWRTSFMPSETKSIIKSNGDIIENKLGTIDAFNHDLDYVIRSSYFGGHVDAYIPHFDNSLPEFKGKILNQYDVVSLYPTVMQNNSFPTEFIGTYTGDITQSSYWNENLSFCQCKVIAPDITNPILPYRSDDRIIYGYGSWEGTYFSEEIKNAMKYGYEFNITKSFLFKKCNKTFQSYIDLLFTLKKDTPKSDPRYQIAKLLMNSLYGRTGIDITNLFKYTIVTIEELEKIDKILIEDILELGTGHAFVAKTNNPANLQGNVSLASAVTAYARIFMSEFKNNPNFRLFYTDTDSAFIDGELPEHLIGKELGQFQIENKYNKFIGLGPKVYGGITIENAEVIKAKGMINKPTFKELEILLNEHGYLEKTSKKSFKDITDFFNRMIWKEVPYLLSPNSNKRILNYENGRLVSTKNIKTMK